MLEGFPPIPPADFIARVAPQFGVDQREDARRDFHEHAVRHVAHLSAAADAVGKPLGDARRLLDFGCGPGRLLRLLEALANGGTELHGVDVDDEVVQWAAAHIPFASFATGPHEPPLPYPDDHFDAVLCHSVFTHLDRARQDMWLAELRRVTSPGGLLLLTIHSVRQWNEALGQMARGGEDATRFKHELEHTGLVFIADDAFIGTTHPDWYHTTFHAPWYVFEQWTRWFQIRAYLPEGSDTQDLVVLESPAGEDQPVPPIRHQAAPAPRVAATMASAGLDRARAALARHDKPTTLRGRVRRKLIGGELARFDTAALALADSVAELGQLVASAEGDRAELRRGVGVTRLALDELAQRLAHTAAEIRAEFGTRDS